MLEGKTILVVGAGGLLGTALVKALLGAQVKVIASDINLEKLQASFALCSQANLTLHELDIGDREALTEFLMVHDELDGAVNCAYPRNKNYGAHLLDVTLSDFNENVSMHLGAHFHFMQACAIQFLKTRRPLSLVNVASIYGVIVPKFQVYNNTAMTMPVEYAAIKSALIHLTRYTAAYISDSNFRANCISPGGLIDGQPQAFVDAYSTQTFGSGMLDPKDMTGTIQFLLSDHSKYINGQNIIVDDGFCL